MDLILASKAELAREPQVSASLLCDENEIVRSQLPRGVRKENRRLQMLDIRRADFGLFWGVLVGSHGHQH